MKKASENKTINYWLPHIQKFWPGTLTVKDDSMQIILQLPMSVAYQPNPINIQLVMKSDFPKSPPLFVVVNDIHFQGLSDATTRRIMTKSLSEWNNKVSLTQVIKEINIFMYNNPPKYKQGSAINSSQPSAGPKAQHHKSHQEEKKGPPETIIEMDKVSLNKPKLDVINSRLDSLNVEQLRELNKHQERLQQFYLQDKEVKEIQIKLNSYKEHIKQIGEKNLDQKNQIKAINSSLDTTFENYQSLKERSLSLRNTMFQQSKGMTSDKIKSILINKAKHADKDSEYIKKDFLNGNLEVKKFVREYTEVRKLYHHFAILGNKIAQKQ